MPNTTRCGLRCRRELGLVDDERWRQFEGKQERMSAEKERLGVTRVQPDSEVAQAFMRASEQGVKAVRNSPRASAWQQTPCVRVAVPLLKAAGARCR